MTASCRFCDFSGQAARAAGVGHLIQFQMHDMRAFTPTTGPPGVLVCNPPYGERLGEEKDLRSLYRALGELFRLVRIDSARSSQDAAQR